MPTKKMIRDLAIEAINCVRGGLLERSTWNEEERSIETILATENPVLAWDVERWEPILEVLRMDGMVAPEGGQVPLLDTHDRSSVRSILGSTRSIRIEGGLVKGRNHYAKTPLGLEAGSLAKDGHLRDNSVGYRALEYADIPAGKTVEVASRSYTAPADRNLRITTRWALRENSNCAIGADANAKMRGDRLPNEHQQPNKGVSTPMNEKLLNHLRSLGLRQDSTPEQARAFFDSLSLTARAALPDGCTIDGKPVLSPDPAAGSDRGTPPAPPAPDEGALRAKIEGEVRAEHAAEQARVAAIRAEGAAVPGFPAEQIEKLVTDKATVDAARAAYLAHLTASRPKPGVPGIAPPPARPAATTCWRPPCCAAAWTAPRWSRPWAASASWPSRWSSSPSATCAACPSWTSAARP